MSLNYDYRDIKDREKVALGALSIREGDHMSEYSRIRRFIRVMAEESGRYDYTADKVDEALSDLLQEHHGYVVTAVNDLMVLLTIEELEKLAVCENNCTLEVCRAHMWTHTAFIILNKTIESLFQVICLEA